MKNIIHKWILRNIPYPEYTAFFLVLFAAFVIMLPKGGHGGDIWCWTNWSKYILDHGLGNVYKSGTDYLPLYHYILFVFAKLQGNAEYIDRYVNFLKVFTLCFDFVTGWILFKIIHQKTGDIHRSFLVSLFFFLNLGYLYNTLVWNQVDGILACLVFLSFYMALRKKVFACILFFVLALNFKLQAIIFFPFIGLLILPEIVHQYSFRKLLLWVVSLSAIQILIVLPFVIAGNWTLLWDVVHNSVGKYPVVSMNAFNFWHWLVRGDLMEVSDRLRWLGISFKNWGLILFCLTSFFTLWPLLKQSYWAIFSKLKKPVEMDKLLLAGALIPFLFFFTNTEMHERYLHPAILFLAAYSLRSGRYFPYILGSIAYLLNLERVLQYWGLKNYHTFLFDPRFIAVLYLVCIVYCFVQLYSQVKIQASDRNILKR